MNEILSKVVAVSIGLVVAGTLIPLGLVTIANANLTGVDETVATIVTVLLPILAGIAIALAFLKEAD
ncbi:MAG: hypothetical protein A2V66_16350 [Ignavibacteria bacterium RBG_13_36_8]|nr:MAG: hypothetical protein A2V66_16350 [Ignavibacteria bacterium RBG_13_36_8]